jgi:hypothetical protein
VGRPSLEGVDLKLNRANDHLEALGESIAAFLRDPDTYSTVADFDEQRRPILRVGDARQPPPDWGVRIGECAYNFHSALDHLAFQLAVANTRGRLPKKIADTSAFPIFDSGPRFRATNKTGQPTTVSGGFKIRGASSNAQAIIERLQPYHRSKNPGARALRQLYELSNIDKHRLLHVTYSSLEGSRFDLSWSTPMTIHGYDFFPGPLKAGAVIARWHLTAPGAIQMNVDAELVTDITFDRTSTARSVRGESVLFTLFGIGSFIASDVLPPLAAEMGLTSTFRPGRLLDAFTADEEEFPPSTMIASLRTTRPVPPNHS